VERARQEVKDVAQGRGGTVHIGLSGSILLGELPTALNAHRRDFPSVTTTLHEMAPVLQGAALIERRIDVSFSRTAPANEALASELAWQEPVVVVLPAGHALARRKRIALADLRREDFVVLHPDSSPFARHLYDCCTEAGFAPRISQRVIESQSIPSLVAAGMGVALVPASIERGNHRQVVFRPLRGPAPAADVHMIYRKDESSPAVLAFLGTARTALDAVREKRAA
jgi:DNA-binding transcriptional LysR family regulator